MRVLLINPPLDSVILHGHVTPVTAYLFFNSHPLGLLYLGAALERAGEQPFVVDAAAEHLDVAGTIRRAEEIRPDIIGIGATTVIFRGAVELAEKLKEAMPGVPILLGGYHVTIVPDDAMKHACFDVGVIDEGDFTIIDLVEHYKGRKTLEDIPGIVFRTPSGSLHFTPPRPKLQDLDRLPFPARHLLPPNLYKPIPIDEHGLPKFAMITSRGCPHGCVFCQKARSGYRSHSPARIADEVQHIVRDFGVKDIAFVDSLFCPSTKRVYGILDELDARRVEVSWTCSSRVEVVDRPLLARMKASGCWRTRYGIESGSDRVLDFISKGITKDLIRNAITWTDEVGLRPKAFFIVGHLVDDRASILETIEFARSIPLHDVTVQINTLLPQTRQSELFRKEPERYGRIVSTSTDESSFWEPTFVPWGLEPEDLADLHRRFYREFYLRPQIMGRHLSNIRSWRDVVKYLQALNLFEFLFYNREKPSLASLKALFGTSGATDGSSVG